MSEKNVSNQIAKHFSEVHFGGNWTTTNIKDTLEGVSWQQATSEVNSLNSILTLTVHMSYYVSAILKVLQGGELIAKDEYSFDHSSIQSQEDWEKLQERYWMEAKELTKLIEQLPEKTIWSNFTDVKYGSYYRNLHGVIEHSHYHLGQISLIKKIISQ
jgi:uncharacterized damage-inducible protein DinB